ncbi:ABC transporter ATP-binding protein [Mycoplasmopsis edwardii]|nr:ABC transporter ATP-binding protein [Mycoplasmopsis edwardii]
MNNKDVNKSLKRIFSYLWINNKFLLIIGVLLYLLATGGMLYNQVFIGKVIIDMVLKDYLATNDASNFNWSFFYLVIAFSALWFLGSIIFKFLGNFILSYITFKTMKLIQDNLYYKIQKLPMGYLNKELKGVIIASFNSDIETLKNFFRDVIPNSINSIITLIVSVIVMFIMSWQLSLIILCFMLIIFITSFFISRKSKKSFAKEREINAKISGYVEEILSGFSTNKIFNNASEVIDKHNKLTEEYRKRSKIAYTYSGIFFPLSFNLGLLGYASVAVFGAIITLKGRYEGVGLTIGTLIAFTQFSKSFANPIGTIMLSSNDILRALAGAKRIFSIMDQPEEKDLGSYYIENKPNNHKVWKNINVPNFEKEVNGEIIFSNVSFKYEDKYILKNISFNVNKGQKIALVGPTGAGKTTIINLIGRFYEINEGEILIDGININDIKLHSLRNTLGFVLQETQLFTDTIAKNVAYGSNNEIINYEDINQALKNSNFDRHLEKFNNDTNTILKNSGNFLSQGQKQLLAISRVNYKKPSIIIMDEATSNVDSLTEKEIQESMNNLTINSTSIIIAHRLSTIKDCDNILVINDGQILEQGNHEQLINSKGKYFELVKHQNNLG